MSAALRSAALWSTTWRSTRWRLITWRLAERFSIQFGGKPVETKIPGTVGESPSMVVEPNTSNTYH